MPSVLLAIFVRLCRTDLSGVGGPLVENAQIDPTVFVDDGGQAYLYWGNPDLQYITLNTDMISYTGSIVKVNLTTAGFGVRSNTERPTAYEEGPWLYKRNDLYYMIYAANCCAEDIRYSTGPSATGPWTYRGLVMATAGTSFTNHPAIVDFQNSSYFFYHNVSVEVSEKVEWDLMYRNRVLFLAVAASHVR